MKSESKVLPPQIHLPHAVMTREWMSVGPPWPYSNAVYELALHAMVARAYGQALILSNIHGAHIVLCRALGLSPGQSQ